MSSTLRVPSTNRRRVYFQLVCLVFFMTADLALAEPGPVFSLPQNICTKPACKATANEFTRNMNPYAPPCTDFFEFACGKFKDHHPLGPEESTTDFFTEMEKEINNRMREIAEAPVKDSDSASLKKAKLAYQVCMNEDALDQEGINPIASDIQKQKGWPMAMDNWNWKSRTWMDIEKSYTSKLGESAFFTAIVERNNIFKSTNTLTLKPPVFLLPSYVLNNPDQHQDKIELYRDFIVDIVKNFQTSVNIPKQNLRDEAQQIINLEIELTRLKNLADVRQRNSLSHTTPKQFQIEYDIIPHRTSNSKIIWMDMINSIFSQTNYVLPPSGFLILENEIYFKQLAVLLDKTLTRVLVNFVHWQYVRRLLRYCDQATRNRYTVLKKELLRGNSQDRWLECLHQNPAEISLIHRYLKNHVSKKSLETIGKMVDYQKSRLEQQILHSTWLDNAMRNELAKKAETVNKFLGYPAWYKDTEAIDKYFSTLVVRDTHFKNAMYFKKFTIYRAIKLLQTPAEKYPESLIWSEGVLEPNAYFNQPLNSLIVPAGMLLSPLFHGEDVPENVLYGSTGGVTGHELSHAFDDQGRQYAYDGSPLAWSQNNLQEYRARANCIVRQFDAYQNRERPQHGRNSYGKRTEKENMADTNGMYVTYATYKYRAAQRNKEYQKLPGLEDLTDDKLFFLSFANTWCSYTKPEQVLFMTLIKASHSIPRHRVIGTLSNIRSFAVAFGCLPNTPMNPRDICYLWD
ncbi:neprilysin-11 [Orussus abietinus]|uniref:neprilysin-11 n=1 Tax=Orussus abietinus TaxID=222816 RepID=UPI00062535E3|nr:neprilysin-11 [Orussus abietinus]